MSTAHNSRTILVAHPSPELYGSDRVLIESVASLVARGHRVVLVLPKQGPLVVAVEETGATVELLATPVLRKSLLRPKAFLGFVGESFQALISGSKLVRNLRPSAVVVNTATIPLWILISRMHGIRSLLHIHESERDSPRLLRVALALPAALTNKVVLNSQYSTDSLLQVAPWLKRKTTIIYNGVPGPELASVPRQDLSDPVNVLFVGRLSERKGAHTAVAAIKKLQEQGVNVRLQFLGAVFEGYEWFEEQLRVQVQALPHPEHVTFLGFQSSVWPHYENCDIALVPSTIDEPFGNTAVEAVLAERPVVVSRVGGLPEAVHGLDCAVLVQPDNPGALAKGIQQIINNWPQFKEAAGKSRELAVVRYDTKTYGASFAHEVEAILP
ncbi:glycosyltransferase family 4 protein [Glutamicibacter sp. BW77]|uniref:glycosyltransferase family 4 protein n=1 Tax=Glutamicibacter sp. BW77 TaxID=2024402 RepID=UPI000BB900F9|nr:glycosyltransferase family 4 protein [Glutamicibacter sp. BW77]PCC34456.1 hypothetical protein CIK74_10585 [Glutamicibacter sp. BW77]